MTPEKRHRLQEQFVMLGWTVAMLASVLLGLTSVWKMIFGPDRMLGLAQYLASVFTFVLGYATLRHPQRQDEP